MKDIIVFGTGKYFESKRQTISEKYHIIGFLDNKQEAGSVSFIVRLTSYLSMQVRTTLLNS